MQGSAEPGVDACFIRYNIATKGLAFGTSSRMSHESLLRSLAQHIWCLQESLHSHASGSGRLYTVFLISHLEKQSGTACRGRCTAMLEDGEAFKARARLRSVYSSEVAKGRPLLPAAVQAERMVRELVEWATQMPLFATQLTGAGHA